MSRRVSKRVSFSSDEVNGRKPSVFLNHGVGAIVGENTRRVAGIFSFRLTKSSNMSPARVLRQLGAKVARVLCFVSTRRKKSSGKASTESSRRSRSVAGTIDTQRAEAIEDCIEYLNSSSSSLSRSNSVFAGSRS